MHVTCENVTLCSSFYSSNQGRLIIVIHFPSVSGIPVLALIGTADLKMGRKIPHLLSLTPDVHCITLGTLSSLNESVDNGKRDRIGPGPRTPFTVGKTNV